MDNRKRAAVAALERDEDLKASASGKSASSGRR